jgi:hypothetical protein
MSENKNTPYVAELLGITIHAVLKCGKHIGIVYKNGQSMFYTDEQIEQIKKLAPVFVKPCKKGNKHIEKELPMNPSNPEWWVNPIPDCLLDEEDFEKEKVNEEITD